MLKIYIAPLFFSSLLFAGTQKMPSDLARSSMEHPYFDQAFHSRRAVLESYAKNCYLVFSQGNPGAIRAARSTHYSGRTWVRDSAIVNLLIGQIADNYFGPVTENYVSLFRVRIFHYHAFTQIVQSTPNRLGGPQDPDLTFLGEPIHSLEGGAINEDWGRPQNDGPALRALSFLTHLEKNPNLDSHFRVAIQKDLHFVSKNFKKPGYDIWEEVFGEHFFTKMVQRAALAYGSVENPEKYRNALAEIDESILGHWNADEKLLLPTLNANGGIQKNTNLDIAIILGVLYGNMEKLKPLIDVDDERVLATAEKLMRAFEAEYSLNKIVNPTLAPSMGRYPGDVWNGFERGKPGNPWFISTCAMAELMFKIANKIEKTGDYEITPLSKDFYERVLHSKLKVHPGAAVIALRAYGEKFLNRVIKHRSHFGNGGLTEQYDRETGFATGPQDLTWSHVAFLHALIAHPEYRTLAYRLP